MALWLSQKKKIKAEEKQVAVYVHNVRSVIHTNVTASSELQPPLHTAPQEVVKIARFVKLALCIAICSTGRRNSGSPKVTSVAFGG
jgi:hypothetical protein